jgi:hypothetical protein
MLCQRLDVGWRIREVVHSLALRAYITRNLSVDKCTSVPNRLRINPQALWDFGMICR